MAAEVGGGAALGAGEKLLVWVSAPSGARQLRRDHVEIHEDDALEDAVGAVRPLDQHATLLEDAEKLSPPAVCNRFPNVAIPSGSLF